jgi:small redox-active disulfide protein 2
MYLIISDTCSYKIKKENVMIIKVLGSGCKNCVNLKENTEKALKETGIDAEIIKIENMKDIISYGVMQTPALVIDEKVVSYGKVLKSGDIAKLLEKNK